MGKVKIKSLGQDITKCRYIMIQLHALHSGQDIGPKMKHRNYNIDITIDGKEIKQVDKQKLLRTCKHRRKFVVDITYRLPLFYNFNKKYLS